MGDVVNLAQRRAVLDAVTACAVVMDAQEAHPLDPEAAQHGQGLAFCIACDHEWQAVAPTGTIDLECPQCRTMKGKWKFEFRPDARMLVRECNCGNQLFYLTPDGHMCANCGIYQRYD